MPIETRVTAKDTGTGVQAQGDIQDIPGPGGKAYDAEIIMVIDPAQVRWSGYASPKPYKKVTNSGDIRFWWKATFNPHQAKEFKVGLTCKRGANGPTAIAITACSDANTSASAQRFSAAVDIFYHSWHCCRQAARPSRPKGLTKLGSARVKARKRRK